MFEQQFCTLGSFVDYSKVFDCINHATLLNKLEDYGFRGIFLELIQSYLQHHTQQVIIERYVSNLKPVHAGVPQGSILGPLLFCIYNNDLVTVDNNVKFIMYADDTTILVTAPSSTEAIGIANEALTKLSSWSTANSLGINIKKTTAVLFRPRNRNVVTDLTLQLNNYIIPIAPTVKCLGVVFEQHMSWNMHVDLVAAKMSRVSGISCRLRYFLPKSIKLLL